jgi:hypothetical protein
MLGRLARAAPLVALVASRALCKPLDHFEKASKDLEMLEVLMAGTESAVPPDLAASIISHHPGDDARVRILVDWAIARGANTDAALRAAYRGRDHAMIAHLLRGRTTVPSDSIRLMVAGERRRREWSEAPVDNAPLLARLREAAALGADPSAVDWCGSDPAIVDAVAMCDAELVGCLLQLGADPAGADYRKRSALWLAIDKKQPAIVRLLLEAAARRVQGSSS